ncbi:MAG: histidine kinase dimerization/phosphoacceptor domain -containing protein [Crocinitomicaceae bacterium]|nr:histidine kinase dimerization/phosphoacceptor domain -containing protein [Crocinitomicaceae bacterium]
MPFIKEKISSNSTKGIDFLNSFVSVFNSEIGSDFTFIGSVSSDFMKVRTVSLMHQGKLEENFEYRTEHTPCQEVLASTVCAFPEKVQELFPKDDLLIEMGIEAYVGYPLFSLDGKKVIGLVASLFRDKIDHIDEVIKKFELLGPRIEMELDRFLLSNELAETETTYRTVVNQISEGVTIADMEGNYISVNSAFCTMSGYSEAELLTKTVFDMKAENQPHESFYESKEELEGVPIRVNLKRKDGSEYLTEIIGDVITINNKQLVIGTIRDVTEKVNTETQIESLNQNLELTVKERTEELKKTIDLKDLLLKEVTHRVKNNLQVICSILNLQKGTVKSEESTILLIETVNRIHAMSLIHETLYKSKQIGEVRFADYMKSLLKYVSGTFDTSEIEITTEIDDVVLSMDAATCCGMIVMELMTNSLKYAFPEKQNSKIAISMSIDGANQCVMSVHDNGVGYPDINLLESESIGMQLISSLSEQLEGTVTMKNEDGAKFELIFSL